MARGGEPERVTGVADEHGSDHRADTEDVGQGGSRGRHRGADVRLGQLELVVDVNKLVGELAGETMPFDGGDTFGVDALEKRESVADHDLFADPASDELGHQGVETTTDLVPPPGQVGVILGSCSAASSAVAVCEPL